MMNGLFGPSTPKAPKGPMRLLQIDPVLLQGPRAQLAWLEEVLKAKRWMLIEAWALSLLGLPLQAGVIGVSVVHIWQQMGQILPPNVVPLVLDAWVYHDSALAFTVSIDLALLYIILSAGLMLFIQDAGAAALHRGDSRWFFYVLTGLLNGLFVITYSPGVAPMITDYIAPIRLLVALMLACLIPVAVQGIEAAKRRTTTAKVALGVECGAIRGALEDMREAQAKMVAPRALPPSPVILPTPVFAPVVAVAPVAPPLPSVPVVPVAPVVSDVWTLDRLLQKLGIDSVGARKMVAHYGIADATTARKVLSQSMRFPVNDPDTATFERLWAELTGSADDAAMEVPEKRMVTYKALIGCLVDIPDLATASVAQRIGRTHRTVQQARKELAGMGVLIQEGDVWRLGKSLGEV